MSLDAPSRRTSVAGHPVDAVSKDQAVQLIMERALGAPGAYVCLTNANNVVHSKSSSTFRRAVQGAFLSLPDGYPVAWVLRRRGYRSANKLGGPDLMPLVAAEGRQVGLRHFMYGWTTRLATAAGVGLARHAPGIELVGAHSPPFARNQGFCDDTDAPPGNGEPLAPSWIDIGGPVSEVDWELGALQDALKRTRPHVLWVGLGAPVQEEWMAMASRRLDVPVMIGVGRAFNYQAGTLRRAPRIMVKAGFEWLYTFLSEPKRLWRRYLLGNPRFLYLVARSAFSREDGPRQWDGEALRPPSSSSMDQPGSGGFAIPEGAGGARGARRPSPPDLF